MKKIKNSLYALLASTALLGLGACQADMDTPALEVPVATLHSNISILDLKNAYEHKTQLVYMPGTWVDKDGHRLDENLNVLDADGNPTGETGVIAGGDPVYIHGRVISSDATGNIYKSLVIQDETAALAFSLNQGQLFNTYRLGQEVVVDLTGVMLGNYRNLQQIGTLTDETYDDAPQLGFMAYDRWLSISQLNGLPDPAFRNVSLGSDYPSDNYYCIKFADFDGLSNGTLPELQSQLVEFQNVHFQIKPGEETYAPYQESVNRTLVDVNGKTLTLRNSGYSNFYNKLLPEGTGTVRGILSYYGSDWQLLLRGPEDVMITTKGQEEDPFTVPELLSNVYEGYMGWAEGYIVGSVKAGVKTVSSAADVVFGSAAAELDNNVLIAANASETDWTQCAVVALPQNTLLRASVNLLDNPNAIGKLLKVKGTLGFDLGLPGIITPRGGKGDFYLDGVIPSDGTEAPPASGSGTEADPYNITYVMETTADENGVWVVGYVAGYVTSGNFSEMTAEFSALEVAGSSNWLNQSNVILSGLAPMKCAVNNSVPCQLNGVSRPVMGLKDNPSVFGKQVLVKCNIASYLGTRGVTKITEVKLK